MTNPCSTSTSSFEVPAWFCMAVEPLRKVPKSKRRQHDAERIVAAHEADGDGGKSVALGSVVLLAEQSERFARTT